MGSIGATFRAKDLFKCTGRSVEPTSPGKALEGVEVDDVEEMVVLLDGAEGEVLDEPDADVRWRMAETDGGWRMAQDSSVKG